QPVNQGLQGIDGETPPPAPEERPSAITLPFSTPSVTYTLIGVTSLIYGLQVLSVWLFGYANNTAQLDLLELYGARISPLIRDGQLWRFLTPALLHASIPHILFNMYALFVIGVGLERNFGHQRFLLLYVLGAFAGNV